MDLLEIELNLMRLLSARIHLNMNIRNKNDIVVKKCVCDK